MNNYAETWESVRRVVYSSAVNVAWTQWSVLGSPARSKSDRNRLCIVDPEALILLSLAFRGEERRLEEMVEWWAKTGSPYYATNQQVWIDLLEPGGRGNDDSPTWCMWMSFFGFLIRAKCIASAALDQGQSDHVTASMARDAVEDYEHAFSYHGIALPNPSTYPGREFVRAFLRITQSFANWTEGSVTS